MYCREQNFGKRISDFWGRFTISSTKPNGNTYHNRFAQGSTNRQKSRCPGDRGSGRREEGDQSLSPCVGFKKHRQRKPAAGAQAAMMWRAAAFVILRASSGKPTLPALMPSARKP